jgi:hypothetical protein
MGIDTLGFADYLGLEEFEINVKAKRKVLRPASNYSECKGRSSNVGVSQPHTGTAKSRRRERENQRAMDAWLATTPGTPEAVELLRKWMSLPSC